ncbi:hypothetical protein [Ralstonia mannitolilytica]|uniref:Uncharacterized protein n=1 Tax=Ralstonia mannitolilytica TaxID=105219 RepID=A0AAJ4ZKE4_9RALS|nr:hypothetical protein [Ralstonia mannitolilytica]CAG2152572.1 hypothetical protein LMG6866_04283 [Ralstonia mannitolilytica]SUD87357.1 Uncharacterised protein [Ralstonia mannitolilytica]SUD97018.1 Uncharacterised protein [Ralstonia mannitolilytica]
MSSVVTTLCEATSISVGPVKFAKTVVGTGPLVFATQRIEITLHDGNRHHLSIHLAQGAHALAVGDPVTMPTLDEVPA